MQSSPQQEPPALPSAGTGRHRLLPVLAGILWVIAVVVLVRVSLLPVNSGLSRGAGVLSVLMVWGGVLVFTWRWRLTRWAFGALTLLAGVLLVLPVRESPPAGLRDEYVRSMQHYEGVPYYWGGENSRGIDCSGLVRRGLIDALVRRGLRPADGGLLRAALSLWWRDRSARDLGQETDGLTKTILTGAEINTLDHTLIQPGDLAVTADGVHILAYTGEQRWIQADPVAGRVITLTAPAADHSWFRTKVKIVRWSLLN